MFWVHGSRLWVRLCVHDGYGLRVIYYRGWMLLSRLLIMHGRTLWIIHGWVGCRGGWMWKLLISLRVIHRWVGCRCRG